MSAADRISELPEGILHHILFCLPIKDAVSTSVLSKRWNKAWETLSYLNFNEESFMTCNSNYREQFGKNIDLLAAMRRIVRSRRERERQHMISIQKFCLFVPPWQDEQLDQWPSPSDEEERSRCREIVFSCLSYVATPFLRELKLINGITWQSRSSGNLDLLLPPTILSVKWLTTLNLKGFDLCSSCSSIDIKFTCLQKLALEYVILDDNILKNLTLGSCSSLAILKLKHCTGFKIIHLNGEFVKLKQLKVHLDIRRSIEVVEAKVYDTPEFEDLRVLGYIFSKCYFNVKNCPRLKKVFIDGNFITEDKLQQLLASFDHLEELSFKNCSILKNVNISSDSLKKLSLYFIYNLKKLHIFSPTLKSLTLELPDHVLDFSLNGSDVVGVQINLIIHTQFGFRCVKFLQNFKHTKKVTIQYNSYNVVIIPEYIIEKLLSPLYGTKHISFKQGIECPILKILMKDKVTKLLKYLLWLAPRAERVSIVSFDNTTLLSIELMYHNEEKKKIFNCCYCKLLPIDCWRHCLEEVRIHRFNGSEYDLVMMKDFFLKEIKNLKIVDNVCQQQLITNQISSIKL